MKLVHQHTGPKGVARVYRDDAEYVAQLWEFRPFGMLHIVAADYFTEDKADAIGTARAMVAASPR